MKTLADLMPAVLCRACRGAVPLALFVTPSGPRREAPCPHCRESVNLGPAG